MPEEDGKIFGEAYELYEQWRSTLIETPEQWIQVTNEMHDFVCRHNSSRLALRLATGIMDTLDDLYKGGQRPPMADYLGRSDISEH